MNEFIPVYIEHTSHIPVKYIIEDPYHDIITEMREIMNKSRRNSSDKEYFMTLLCRAIEEHIITVIDNNEHKIDCTKFILTEFRCYKKGENKQDEEVGNESNDSWRFKTYHAHVEQKMPFVNGQLQSGQCGLYCSMDIHIHSENGHKHFPHTLYILYSK